MAREEARAGIAVASPDALINVLRVRGIFDITQLSYHSLSIGSRSVLGPIERGWQQQKVFSSRRQNLVSPLYPFEWLEDQD